MARPVRPAPRTFSVDWPDVACTDDVAEVARRLAVNLRTITNEVGVRELARRTGVNHSIIARIVNGDAWADTATLARLELALNRDLWPGVTRRGRSVRKGRG